jgi:hypothetical protein
MATASSDPADAVNEQALIERGYQLLFDALMSEPLLNLTLLHAIEADAGLAEPSKPRHLNTAV